MSSRTAAALAGLTAWLLPGLARACPVCFDQNAANRDAFLYTTILLSLLPLALIGGFALFVHARARARSRATAAEAALREPGHPTG